MQDYYVVSFSGGKDSTAMLLRLIELNYPINEVIFCDTYKEFPQMYDHVKRIKQIVEDNNIKFTTLKSERTFDEWMFEYTPKRRTPEKFKERYGDAKGMGWATPRARWCTGNLKIKIMDKYFKTLSTQYKVYQYIGFAADEQFRVERENAKTGNKLFPLVDWGWTEKDALEYCYSKGYDWGGLYTKFSRVSCWCCPLQSLEELRILRKDFPDLWQELREMDARTWQIFRKDFTVEELEKRFAFEETRLAEGKSIRSREFFTSLREILKEEE